MKFHVNGAGEARRCSATVQNCPFGGETKHFATEAAARAAYEMHMRDKELLMVRLRNGELVNDAWDEFVASVGQAEEELGWHKLPDLRREAKAKRPYLTDDQADAINVDGITCPHCEQQVRPQQAALLLDPMQYVACDGCGRDFDLYSVHVEVGESKSTYAAFDAAEIPRMTWYHSTTAEDWESFFEDGGFVAHLGSPQAALDRRIAEDYHTTKTRDGFYLYEVKIDPDASIAPEVAKDENEDYNAPGHTTHDVHRYVNKWEDMASVSLAAHTSAIRVLGRRFVTFEEAMDSPSLYNVKVVR